MKKNRGKNRTEKSSFTLSVALNTISGAKIKSIILATVSLLQFKKAELITPNIKLI